MSETEALAVAIASLLERIVEQKLAQRPAAPSAEGYIGTAEAARRLGVKPDTVLAWIERGALPASRLPGSKSWRIRPSDLDAALAQAGTSPARTEAAPVNLEAKRAERAHSLAAAVHAKRGPKGPR